MMGFTACLICAFIAGEVLPVSIWSVISLGYLLCVGLFITDFYIKRDASQSTKVRQGSKLNFSSASSGSAAGFVINLRQVVNPMKAALLNLSLR